MGSYETYSATKGVSPGMIWQDSALSAARMVEKYMSQEEQMVRLSDLHSSPHTEYERTTGNVQLQLEESVVGSPLGDLSKSARSGTLTGTSYLWRALGGSLRIWDCLDRTNTRSCEFEASKHSIVAVELLSKSSFLIVATTWDVSLFYFDAKGPVFSGILTPTGGAHITCIATCGDRIFLGALDGSLFEFLVNGSSCLRIISRPLLASLPAWLCSAIRWVVGPPQAICSLATDPSRNLLFATTASELRTFDVVKTPFEISHLSEYSIKSAASLPLNEIVSVVGTNLVTGGDVTCVLITRSGWRIYVAGSRVLSAKQPPRHPQLEVLCASSPDNGKTIICQCADGLGVIAVDDAIAGRERWDWLPLIGEIALVESSPWQAACLTSEGLTLIGPAPQWEGGDQIAAHLVAELANFVGTEFAGKTLDKLMDPFLSQVESAPVTSGHLLGGVARTPTVNLSWRIKGVALMLARELKSVWFEKCFDIDTKSPNSVTLRPHMTLAQREAFGVHVLGPIAKMFAVYKPMLAENNSFMEGFSVLVSALQECLELFRIVDTGQLEGGAEETSNLLDPTLVEQVDQLLLRDLVLSAGVGDPVLKKLLRSANLRLAAKHCPLLVHME